MSTVFVSAGLILSILLATACGSGTSPPTTVPNPTASPTMPISISLNTPFTLQVGQKVVLELEPLTITFDTVLEDGRCPSSVQCAEAGFARIVVVVQSAEQSPIVYDMNSEPFYKAEMGLGVNTVTHSGYNIQLLKLDPYPEMIDQTIQLEDYRATFVVNMAPPTPTAEPTASPTSVGPLVTIVETDGGPPFEAEDHYHKGLTYLAAGLTEEAIVSLTEAITLYPTYTQAYQYRGDAYRELGRYDLALADYQQALALNPEPEIQATVTTALQEIGQAQSVLPTATVTSTPTPAAALPPSPPVTIMLNTPFSLKLNQQGVLETSGLTLEFVELLEDSRCPRQVDCFWSGQGRLVIEVWLTGREPTAFELNTLSSTNQNVISYEVYQIQLLSLDPYPETPEHQIVLEDYQATFVITLK